METIQRFDFTFEEEDERNRNLTKILEILNEKANFEGFLHFTDLKNMKSIISCKSLFCRDKVRDMLKNDAADHEVLEHTSLEIMKYVRFFYKERTPTCYINEGIKSQESPAHMPIPVLMVFDKNIIFHDNIAFLNGGGGSNLTRFTTSGSIAAKYDWDSILYRGVIPKSDDLSSEERLLARKMNNSKNAEFLYKDSISTEFLRKIYFRAPADLKYFKAINEGKLICELEVNPKKFFCKTEYDFLHDYDIKIDSGKMYLGLIFFTYKKEYEHKLCIEATDIPGSEEFILNNFIESNKVKMLPIPSRLEKYDYYIEIEIKKVQGIKFYINDNLCLDWRNKL